MVPHTASTIAKLHQRYASICDTGSALDQYILLSVQLSNTQHCPNSGLVLAQRHRRWANTRPALDQRLVFTAWLTVRFVQQGGWPPGQCCLSHFTRIHLTSGFRQSGSNGAPVSSTGPCPDRAWAQVTARVHPGTPCPGPTRPHRPHWPQPGQARNSTVRSQKGAEKQICIQFETGHFASLPGMKTPNWTYK